MARITYSGLIDEINGSIGGTTFQRNRYGFTIKRKPSGRQSGTSSQLTRRNSMYRVQQGWIGLTVSERANWNTYASTFPEPSRLNPDSFLNGVNLFEKYHLLKALDGTNILDDPVGLQETLSFDQLSIEIVGAAANMTSEITVSGASWIFLLYLSRPVRETAALSKSLTRFIESFTVVGNNTEDIAINYTNIFGFIPSADDFVQTRRVYLNTSNGQIFDEGVRQLQVI